MRKPRSPAPYLEAKKVMKGLVVPWRLVASTSGDGRRPGSPLRIWPPRFFPYPGLRRSVHLHPSSLTVRPRPSSRSGFRGHTTTPGRRASISWQILNEVTYLKPKFSKPAFLALRTNATPRAVSRWRTMAEPGFLDGHRRRGGGVFGAYLLKGGFRHLRTTSPRSRGGWGAFEAAFRRVVTGGQGSSISSRPTRSSTPSSRIDSFDIRAADV